MAELLHYDHHDNNYEIDDIDDNYEEEHEEEHEDEHEDEQNVEHDNDNDNDDNDNDDDDEDGDSDDETEEQTPFVNLANIINTIYTNEFDDNILHNLINEQEYIYDKFLIYISNKKYICTLFIFSILFIVFTENSLRNAYIVSLAYFIIISIQLIKNTEITKTTIQYMDITSIFVCFIFVLENMDIYLLDHFGKLTYIFSIIMICYSFGFIIIILFNILNTHNILFKNIMEQLIFITTILFNITIMIYFCIFFTCLITILTNFVT